MRAMLRVVDLAVAWQLIGFLSMLAPTLAIALTGQAAVAAVGPPGLAQRERQIDERQDVVDTAALLLGSARGQNHRGARVAQQVRRRLDLVRWHTRQTLDALRPVGCDH